MTKSNLLYFAETITKTGSFSDEEMLWPDRILLRVTFLQAQLYGSVALRAQEGEKWASIATSAKEISDTRRSLMHTSMIRLSGLVQIDGFQTDDAYTSLDGLSYHQLTVFWSDGKSIYENQLKRLGVFDNNLLQSSVPI